MSRRRTRRTRHSLHDWQDQDLADRSYAFIVPSSRARIDGASSSSSSTAHGAPARSVSGTELFLQAPSTPRRQPRSPPTPSRAFVAGQRRRGSLALRDEETQRKDSLGFAETKHQCKGAPVFGPSHLSPEPTCKGLQGCSGQEPRGRAKRKDSLSSAVSRHRRKGAPVLGPSPHSPVDTGVRTRRCSGQSATSQATSLSPHSARVLYMAERA